MEVQKHPHHITHSKKWGEYLLEFFMIFLAVFLGVLAETEREVVVEGHKEKQFMASLARDLELDTMGLSIGNRFRLNKIKALDSMVSILATQNSSIVPASVYLYAGRIYGNINFFQNSGTLDQLKNSGGLRLIANRHIVDSIESYDQQVRRMAKRDDFEVDAFLFNNRVSQRVFDAKSVIQVFGTKENLAFVPPVSATIRIHPEVLDEYLNNLMKYESLMKSNQQVFEFDRQKAANLLAMIKKEYAIN